MGEFAGVVSSAMRGIGEASPRSKPERRGLAGWLLDRWRGRTVRTPRLTVAERVNLGPRQTLSLIEVDGERLLLATSPEGAAAFYPLKTLYCQPSLSMREVDGKSA